MNRLDKRINPTTIKINNFITDALAIASIGMFLGVVFMVAL